MGHEEMSSKDKDGFGLVAAHASDKNNDVANVGHPIIGGGDWDERQGREEGGVIWGCGLYVGWITLRGREAGLDFASYW